MAATEIISVPEARRLALARAGLLNPDWTGLPRRASGRGRRARKAAHRILRRFGYLQIDSISIAGARSHAVVLLSRLDGLDPALGEELLQPSEPVFEYWGHEASWLPMELYPVFEFRRRAYRHHPWYGDVVGQHPKVARRIRKRLREEGPLRSVDLEGEAGAGMWEIKVGKKVASAMWSSGEIAIRERRNFQRIYDLVERVIPDEVRGRGLSLPDALEVLLLRALSGHGWATTGTLSSTWRFRNLRPEIARALDRLEEAGRIVPCELAVRKGDDKEGARKERKVKGWIRPEDLDLSARLRRVRPRTDRGVLLSPFDPVLWDRARVRLLFGFEQVLEIFKPAAERVYGYYCLPVLAGEKLVARYDLKADRKAKRLNVLSLRFEDPDGGSSADREAARSALEQYANALRR